MNRETWNLLLVDDNPDDRSHLKSLLRQDEERRYRFAEVENCRSALDIFRDPSSGPCDAILLDYHLPDMDAAAFLAALRGGEEVPPCPVIIITGSASADSARAALRAGAQDYVGKGWMTTQSLSRVIENACERWRMLRTLHKSRVDLETNERFCRAIMESSPDSIKALAPDGRIIRVNAAAVRRWGVADESALIGRRWPEIWPEAHRGLAEEAVKSAQHGQAYRFRSQSSSVEGLERWWDSIVTPLRDTVTNEITGLLATSRDVTEQKRAEDAAYAAQALAEAASKGKDQFLATLSHELRNPLNPVRLTAGEMLRHHDLDTEAREAWQLVLRNVSVQAALIDDLLDLSRITQGKMELSCLEIDAHLILRNALETTRGGLESKRIRLEWRLEAAHSLLWADHVRLQQVFWNLLSNAVKFTAKGGAIEVITSNPDDHNFQVEILDTGIGLTSAELARVFKPFEQGDHTAEAAANHGGLGLGLAISRQLIEMHGGSISAESAGKGQGARFVVRLPLAAEAARHAQFHSPRRNEAVPVAEPSSKGLSLLIVDDDFSTRTTLARLLSKRGYQVGIAGSLAEARKVAASMPFQILLADLGLPDGTGHELMIELRRDFNPALFGIALSGYGMAEDIAASRQAGFSAHIVKPVSLEMLDAELQRITVLILNQDSQTDVA